MKSSHKFLLGFTGFRKSAEEFWRKNISCNPANIDNLSIYGYCCVVKSVPPRRVGVERHRLLRQDEAPPGLFYGQVGGQPVGGAPFRLGLPHRQAQRLQRLVELGHRGRRDPFRQQRRRRLAQMLADREQRVQVDPRQVACQE